MLLISCPFCGDRDEIEFSCGGESYIDRPGPPEAVTAEQWAEYLFFRDNVRGPLTERWRHTYGCGRWLNIERDTVSHRILSIQPVGPFRQGRP